MAQVKKFKTPAGPVTVGDENAVKPAGTSTPTGEVKKKYGKWVRDGIETEMTDDIILNFLEDARKGDSDYQLWANDAIAQIRRGEDVNINTLANESNVRPTYANDKQIKKLEKDIPKERVSDAMFNTFRHRYNKSVQRAGQWDPTSMIESKKSTPEKTAFGLGSGSFVYEPIKDKSGNITYKYNSLLNRPEKAHFDRFTSYLLGDKTYRDQFDVSGIDDIEHLVGWFEDLENGEEWLKNLWSKIETGEEIDIDERTYLNEIGLGWDRAKDQTSVAAQNQKKENEVQDDAWTTFNTGNFWTPEEKKYFTYNDGEYSLNYDNLPKDFDPSKNYYFNQEFVDLNPQNKWLDGKIWYDGKWYKDGDLSKPESDLYRMLVSRDYFNMNKRGDYGGANNIMMTTWKVPALKSTEDAAYDNYLGDFYDKNYLFEDIEYNRPGATYDGQPIPQDWSVRRVQNMAANDWDITGRRPYLYRMTDAYGNEVDFKELKGLYDRSTLQKPLSYKTVISTNPKSDYYKRYGETTSDGFTVYKGGSGKWHVSIPSSIGGDDKVFKDMSASVYDVISSSEFKDQYNNNRDAAQDFYNMVRKGNPMSINKLKSLIYSLYPEEAKQQEVANEIIEYFTSKPIKIDKPVASNKRGGIIKAQGGTSTSQETLNKANELVAQYKNPYENPVIFKDGKYQKGSLSETDWAMITGLGLDAAGFVAGLFPGYGDLTNIGLSSIGSNIFYGIADRNQVKAGLAPRGTALKNALVNVGVDLAGVLPIVGDTANAGGFLNKLRKALKSSNTLYSWVKNGFAAVGLASSIPSIDKAIRGEDLTIEEIRDISQGLMTLTGVARRGTKAFNESRLAANAHPDPKPIPRKTKYKTADGTEKDLVFTDDDINKATPLFQLRDQKSRADLAKLIKDRYPDIPDEEVNRILGDAGALRDLGIAKNAKLAGYSTAKEEEKPGWFKYFRKPGERRKSLSERTAEEITSGSQKGSGMNKVAAEWINANGAFPPTGFEIKNQKSRYTRPSLVKTHEKGGVIKAQLGQKVREIGETISNGLAPLNTPDAKQKWRSLTRYAIGDIFNRKDRQNTINAAEESARLGQMSAPQEVYTPNYINAGNAYRHLAESKFQFWPSPTSDPIVNQQMKKQAYDEGNSALAEGINLESQQHSQNNLRNTEEKRTYANIKNEVANTNRKIFATLPQVRAEADSIYNKAASESAINAIYEQQKEADQAKQEALAYAKEKLKYDRAKKYNTEYTNWYNQTFTKDKPFDPTNQSHVSLVQAKQKLLNDIYMSNSFNDQTSFLSPIAQGYYDYYTGKMKSGGKLSAADRININREKAADQIRVSSAKSADKLWENNLRDARKALSKMEDRVHKLLTKLLK